jgi:hypothetical protein
MLVTFPLKYLDLIMPGSKNSDIASALYIHGTKPLCEDGQSGPACDGGFKTRSQ